MDTFANRLRSALTYRGLTQKQLAEASGVTEAAISKYLAGERIPRSVTVSSLAKALHVPIAELIDQGPASDGDMEDAVLLIARNAKDLTTEQRKRIVDAILNLQSQQ